MFPEIKLLMVELAKVSPFVFLLVCCLRVVWNRFERKDAALTQQMVDGRDKLLAITERMIVSQEQNTTVIKEVIVAQKENTQALSQLTENNHDNHLALMRRLDEIDPVRVKPLHQRKPATTDKAQA